MIEREESLQKLINDLPLLVCAVAGPLEAEVAERLFPELAGHPSCVWADRLVRIARQPDFPMLSQAFAACSGVGQALAELDRLRAHLGGGNEHGARQKHLLAGAARRALLKKNTAAFQGAWSRFQQLACSEMPGSKAPLEYWQSVLGPHWYGHSLVPAGGARECLVRSLGLRYALAPYAGVEPLPVAEMPLMLQLALHLAAGDRAALAATRPTGDTEEHIARAACLQMLDGEWEMAAASFADCFRPRSILIYRVHSAASAPLLAFALLCVIRSGMKKSAIDPWLDILQRLLPEPMPGQEATAAAAFVHNLQLVGEVLNSGKSPRYIPDSASTPACLPLALCYRGMGAALRAKIRGNKLVDAAQEAMIHGPWLLGSYAAHALVSTDAALPAGLMELARRRADVAPIYEEVPTMDTAAELRPQVIRESLAQAPARREKLGWDLVLDRHTGTVTELRPVLYSANLGTCQTRDLSKCLGAIGAEQDLAALFMACGANGSDVGFDWLAALAGHPRLRLVAPGKRTTAIALRAEKPRIHIHRQDGFIILEPENTDCRKLRNISAKAWGVLRHSAELDRLRSFLNAYGADGRLRFPAADTEELYRLLGDWERDFDFIGSLSESDETVENDCRLVACVAISPKGSEIRLEMCVLPGSEKTFPPAAGPDMVDVHTGAGIFHVRRDLAKEADLVAHTLAQCPAAEFDGDAMYTPDLPAALSALSQLESAGVTLLQNGKRLRCVTAPRPYVNLKTRSMGSEWFDVGGELVVDEELTLQLRELLDAMDRRTGDFLPIGCGYLRMPATMERQLSALRTLMSARGRASGLSVAALPALAEALGAHNLPPALRERLETAARPCEPPAALRATLRPYQVTGFRWLAQRTAAGIGACLADDMGLGKTVQLIALLLHLEGKGPSLVISPLSLQSNWERELARFAPGLRVLPFAPNRPWHVPTAGEVVLASYGQVTNNLSHFSPVPWNVLALDEAQAIKNPDSQRAKAVCSLPAFARVCLSGTPVENSETDLWSLMRFLNPLLFGTKASFRRRFLDKRSAGYPLRNLVATLFLRRSKEEVLTELPPLIEQVLPVELNEQERAAYEAVRRRTIEELDKDGSRISVLAELMRLRRACCHASLVFSDYTGESSKLRMLLHQLAELRVAGRKALVFSQFTDVLDLVEPLLAGEGIRSVRLDGDTPPKQRTQAVDSFRSGGADVFLISLKAGGTGLNLTEADYVILLDPWWNPAVEAQAASRSHRMGQTRPVTLCRFIASHTIEEKILTLHDTKKELAQALLSGASMPPDQIRSLLA